MLHLNSIVHKSDKCKDYQEPHWIKTGTIKQELNVIPTENLLMHSYEHSIMINHFDIIAKTIKLTVTIYNNLLV